MRRICFAHCLPLTLSEMNIHFSGAKVCFLLNMGMNTADNQLTVQKKRIWIHYQVCDMQLFFTVLFYGLKKKKVSQ